MTVELATIIKTGTFASRPAAAAAVLYYATDTKVLYFSNGSAWTSAPPAVAGADITAGSVTAGKLSATATDKVFGRSTAGAGAGEEIALTAAGRALIDDADAAAQRTTLGVAANPLTTTGDIIYSSSGTTAARLAVGTANQLLHGGTIPAYSAVLPADLDVSADNTTGDATTGHHGLLPKLGGGSTNFLRADGTWNAPAGGGGAGTIVAATVDTSGDRTITSATLADLPSTATSVTFLIPPSGNYLVRLSATAGAQGTANAYQTWGLRESTTIVAGAVGESIAVRQGAAASELFIGAVKEFYFTGGTPGASRTLKWAAASSTSGSGIKANANSPAIMVVVAMP